MRVRKAYSPPDRGIAAPSSAYDTAPQNAAAPPTTHSRRSGKVERMSSSWNPRLVKTPVPIMLATTTDAVA